MIFALYINVVLTLIVVALSVAFFMFNTFLMKKSQPYFYSQQNLLGAVNAKAEEAISGHLVIKSFGGENETKQDFSESNNKLAKDAWISQNNTPLTLDKVKGNITFSDVKFGYVKDKIIIHDFSADIKAGNKIAIVGPTGAGKSTIMNLLMRFYELNGGKILVDGVSIADLARNNLHEFIGLVPQDIWTFEGSIRENIVYSTKNISDDKLNNILEASGLVYFVRAMHDGVDTVINEQSNLSTGQRQLITIARAMAKDSPILILDEATSSVDSRTEKLIQAALDKLMAGRTSFIIAHILYAFGDLPSLLWIIFISHLLFRGKCYIFLLREGLPASS